ncbi:hypothetical protein [Pleurocapsa sp. PCC 7319]|uniref:hypothetical protein n=1 Tax=Pleurocapsa sp. PCC 7319 TaxID=118161 RepID=UPI00034C921A|nr:hypothetical protein [Pleurocapsa sp. PCC 7319]
MKSTVAIVSTLLVTTLGFSNVATANEGLVDMTNQQNQQETLMAGAGAAAGVAGEAAAGTVDPVGIAELIMQRVGTDENRDAFVKAMVQETWQAYDQQYNVMVFNLNQEYDSQIDQVDYKTVNYDGIPYGVWIFREGEFTNQGDGGYINWAFKGKFDREGEDGKHVKFYAN